MLKLSKKETPELRQPSVRTLRSSINSSRGIRNFNPKTTEFSVGQDLVRENKMMYAAISGSQTERSHPVVCKLEYSLMGTT